MTDCAWLLSGWLAPWAWLFLVCREPLFQWPHKEKTVGTIAKRAAIFLPAGAARGLLPPLATRTQEYIFPCILFPGSRVPPLALPLVSIERLSQGPAPLSPLSVMPEHASWEEALTSQVHLWTRVAHRIDYVGERVAALRPHAHVRLAA